MKLYKYHSININLLNSLRTQTNWHSKLPFLNDPYECFIINNTEEKVFEELNSIMCVCSFSKNMDNILMWSHYADGHRGVCLEWEIDEEKIKHRLFDIKYDNTIIIIDAVERTDTGKVSFNLTNFKFITQKFKNWEYEEEIRTIAHIAHNLGNGVSIPFLGKLTSIYFGKNATPDNIELVKHNAQHIPDIEYKQVDLDLDTMKMKIV